MHLAAQEDRVSVAKVLYDNGSLVDPLTKSGITFFKSIRVFWLVIPVRVVPAPEPSLFGNLNVEIIECSVNSLDWPLLFGKISFTYVFFICTMVLTRTASMFLQFL